MIEFRVAFVYGGTGRGESRDFWLGSWVREGQTQRFPPIGVDAVIGCACVDVDMSQVLVLCLIALSYAFSFVEDKTVREPQAIESNRRRKKIVQEIGSSAHTMRQYHIKHFTFPIGLWGALRHRAA